jgi:hypothetical protein
VPGTQTATAVLLVLLVSVMATVVVLARGVARRWACVVLVVCAVTALSSWTRNGRFQDVYADVDPESPAQGKARLHRPFHFHDFLHYYLGPKYFREMGYLGLYGCLALADTEIAVEDHRPPRIDGPVRDLAEILIDKPHDVGVEECRAGARARFSDARWTAFKNDVRELARLTLDPAWNRVVMDAGFNPPPAMIVLTSPITNLIPIRAGSWPTYLVATGIDLVLLAFCFLMAREGLGNITAAVFATFFGASFVSDYSWNGGSVLRFTWFVSLVLGIVALKKRRWEVAGALLGFATCDRMFPLAFAAAGMLPIAVRARHSPDHRAILRRFGLGFGAVVIVLVLLSVVVYGASSWSVFFARIRSHDEVYHPLHLGLKKVLTFRDWVPFKNFNGADGNARYREWNLALRATWSSMRPLVLPLQLGVGALTAWAASRRRPHEAALIGGVITMFTFSLPANYYLAILALIPALAVRAAATATSAHRRWLDFTVFVGFAMFWMFTFVAPFLPGDDITFTFRDSTALFAFLVGWAVLWSDLGPFKVQRVRSA